MLLQSFQLDRIVYQRADLLLTQQLIVKIIGQERALHAEQLRQRAGCHPGTIIHPEKLAASPDFDVVDQQIFAQALNGWISHG